MRRPFLEGTLLAFLISGASLCAGWDVRQDLSLEPPPPILAPRPPSPEVQRHYDALKLYTQARRLQQRHEIVEALKLYEEALKTEPSSPHLYKAVIPLYLHLDRRDQVLERCQQGLKHAPEDFDLLSVYGHELRERGQTARAAEVLARAARLPAAKEDRVAYAQLCMTLGTLYEDQKQYVQAAEAYRLVAQALEDPGVVQASDDAVRRKAVAEETAKIYERLGRVEMKGGRFDEAIAAFEKAQEKDPIRASRLHYNLCDVYLARRQPKQALAHLERYIASQPGGSEAYEKLGEVLALLDRRADYVPALEAAAQRDPFNQSLRLVLARSYQESGQPQRAEAIYTAAMRDDPTEEAYQGLARLYQEHGRCDELVRRLNQDLSDPRRLASARPQMQVLLADRKLAQGVAQAARSLPNGGKDLDLKTRRVLSTLCRQARLFDLAEYFCRSCLADEPQPDEVYLELSRILNQAGKHEENAALCGEALSRKLRTPPLTFKLERARALALAGKFPSAIAQAQEAVQETQAGTEDHYRARFMQAVVLYRCQELGPAQAEAEKLLDARASSLDPRQVRHLLSNICMARRDHAAAEMHLQKILEIDPNDPGACNDLGYLWADQNRNLEEAERLIRKALEADRAERGRLYKGLELPENERDNAAYVDSLAWVLYRRGKLDEACQLLEQATELVGGAEDPTLWDHLGEIYLAMGLTADARIAWTRAVDLYRTSPRPGSDDRRQEVEQKLGRLIQQKSRK